MPLVIIAALGLLADLIIPGVIVYLVFGPGSTSNAKKIENFGSAIVQGPVNTAVDAWVKVALIFTGIGIGVWVLESELSSHNPSLRGTGIVPGTGPPAPPTFGAAGGIGFQKGGFGIQQGVSAGGPGAPSVQYVETGGGERGSRVPAFASSYGRGERRPSRAERRTGRQANVAENRARIAAAEAKAEKARAGGGFARRRRR